MKFILPSLLLAFSITGLNASLNSNDDFNASDQYCEMWEIWHDSDGEYGWPDTENMYKKECI